ncbi:hypothetical protein ACFQ07_34150 [Actinomadura adrarensis]|uniref:Uncharacterized protein n=1 Tax=Actinomadura adrarensis TaxID=1819600 RepID=A0ABW3CV09_9ACTN
MADTLAPSWPLRLDEDQLTVSTPTVNSVIGLTLDAADYPNTDTWFTHWTDEPRPCHQVALHPGHLARLAKLRAEEPGVPLRLQLGETATKPVAFRMGARLAGVLMPVRLTG